MKKNYVFKLFALTVLMFGAFLCNAVAAIDLPFQSDFSGVPGASVNANSNMPAITATTMPAGFMIDGSSRIFGGGQKLKFGSNDLPGVLFSDVINTNGVATIEVKFNAIAWPQTSEAKTAKIILTYGTQTQEIILAGKIGWPVVASDLIEYSCVFTAIATPTALTFETTAKTTDNEYRMFLDNVRITASSANIVATPTFTPVAGTYFAPQSVTLSCATSGATIRYTTDGTNPTATSPVYSNAINVSATTTIKAMATKTGMDNSNIATAVYTIIITSGIDLPFQSDFSEVGGVSDTSSSSMPALTEMPVGFMFIGSQGIYAGGQKLKFGTSSGVGILPTDVINTNGATAIEVKFNAIAWPTATTKTAQVIVTYGTQTEEFTVAGKTHWPVVAGDLIEYSCQFTAIAASTSLSFKTTGNTAANESRIFFDNVRITVPGVLQVATPTFTPGAGNYTTPQSVTINCATEGAAIHYTTDGTNPTATSLVYSAPINVSTTTTIKAIGTKTGYSNSSIATAVYTFPTGPTEVPNIAAFKAANPNPTITPSGAYKITGDVTFVYKTGRFFYIKDATGGLLIYDNATPVITNSYNNGDLISGGVIGTCVGFNGMYELIPTVDLAMGTPGTPVQPINITMANLLNNFAAYESQLVKLSNVTFDEGTFGTGANGNINIYQDENQMVCRNNYGNITGYETNPSKHFDVIGFVIPYNADRQIAPRDVNDIKESSSVQLSGTVTITGATVFGETLTATANLTSTPTIPDLGAITYQWMRGSNIIGTNSATYTLAQGDIGYKISVTVTAANCSGGVTSAETAIVSKATQTAPAAPTLASKTTMSITLNEISGCEYRKDGGAWQTSTTFDGLTPNTTYSFEARKAETATHLASGAGPAAQFKTDPVGVNENELNKIQVYGFQNKVYIAHVEALRATPLPTSIKIFDMTGRLVYQNEINKAETVITLQVNTGIYHVVLQNGDTRNVTKVLLTK